MEPWVLYLILPDFLLRFFFHIGLFVFGILLPLFLVEPGPDVLGLFGNAVLLLLTLLGLVHNLLLLGLLLVQIVFDKIMKGWRSCLGLPWGPWPWP